MNIRFSAVLFDLDGTLLDTVPDLTDAVNGMRSDQNLSALRLETVAGYVGKGTRNLVARSLAHGSPQNGATPTEPQIDEARTRFNRHYHRVNGNKSLPYPGAMAGLQAFRDLGLKMAVVTNKPTEFTLPLLERLDLARFFDAVVCGDTCAQKKPHPMPLLHACALMRANPSNALFVGDSIHDVAAARAANMAVLAVPYGYNEGKGVRDLEADDIVASIDAAAAWVQSHDGFGAVPFGARRQTTPNQT